MGKKINKKDIKRYLKNIHQRLCDKEEDKSKKYFDENLKQSLRDEYKGQALGYKDAALDIWCLIQDLKL